MISVEENRSSYTSTGNTEFPWTFKIFKASDLEVYTIDSEDEATLHTYITDYTLSGIGVESGGTVTFNEATTVGDTILLWGAYDYTQPVDFVQGDAFPSQQVEDGLDKLTMLAIKNKDEIDRVPKFSIASTTTDITFPLPAAGKLIGWDEDGTDLQNWDNPEVSAAAAAASASLAGAYATDAYNWANRAEDSQYTSTSGLQGYSAYHWYLQSDEGVGSFLVNKDEQTVTDPAGTDTFTLPWEVSTSAENISVFADGIRLYPSEFSLTDSTTLVTTDTQVQGTEMLFCSTEAQTGYIGLVPEPASDLSDAGKVLRVAASAAIYELMSFNDIGFDAGTKMYFYQDTAPTGWSTLTTITDRVLAVKGGSLDYNTTGGTEAGTWTIPTGGGSIGEHTHATIGHSLTLSEIPAHQHVGSSIGGGNHGHGMNYSIYVGTGGHDGQYGSILGGDEYTTIDEVEVTGDGTHTHTLNLAFSGGSLAHDHGETGASVADLSGGLVTTWRPYAAVGIICVKDTIGGA